VAVNFNFNVNKFYVKSEKMFQRSFKRLNFEKLVHNVLTFYPFNNHDYYYYCCCYRNEQKQ
jgi:hypothetical protein